MKVSTFLKLAATAATIVAMYSSIRRSSGVYEERREQRPALPQPPEEHTKQPATTTTEETRVENVDVVFSCKGSLGRFLKPLLHLSSASITFHAVGNERCRDTLASYHLPGGELTQLRFYSWPTARRSVKERGAGDGNLTLLRLDAAHILPESVKRAVLLDTDVYFIEDIVRFYRLFDDFRPEQAFGVVREFSDYYRKRTDRPALRGGFNCGVMLLDLEKMRRDRVDVLWRTELGNHQKQMRNPKKSHFTGQDVFNLVVSRQPQLLRELSCSWNVQWTLKMTECIYERQIFVLRITAEVRPAFARNQGRLPRAVEHAVHKMQIS